MRIFEKVIRIPMQKITDNVLKQIDLSTYLLYDVIHIILEKYT